MAPTDEESRILDPCPNCTTLIDVTAMEPFAEIHCPICGTRMTVRKQFNNFALQKVIGEGGMGTVFEAIDLNLQRPVAVKILKKEYSADAASITQLETEARITASISHPHVVRVFSAGHDHGQFYLAMELVGRGTLDQLMNLQGQVAEIQVLDVGIQIADGLRAAAQIGLIHRDVKPGNILFSDAHTAKVVDFGLAILMEDEAKTRGEIWGTPYYVAPEKLNNEPEDFRSDIYSLGGTLFHALSGRPPFEAASASLVALKHLKSQAVSLQAFAPDVSNETAYVINRMLHKDPLQRYQSYDEVIEHLKYAKTQLLARTASGSKGKTRVVVESDETKSLTAWFTLGLMALLIAMGVYVWLKRATLFPANTAASKTEVTARPATDYSAIYQEAISLLARGNSEEAVLLFDQIIASTDAAPPQRSWAFFQKGLAAYINTQPNDAREVFADLQSRGLFSQESNEVRLAGFFVESSRILADPAVIPAATAEGYSSTNFEAMALLAFAFKDWALNDFAAAGPLLQKFTGGRLDDEYTWISPYQELAEKYLRDYRRYTATAARVKAASTVAEKKAALQLVQETSAKLETSGPLPLHLQSLEAQLGREVAAAQKLGEEQAADVANKLSADESAQWKILSADVPTAIRNFAPEAALARLQGASFTDAAILQNKQIAEQRMAWLIELKTKLIDAMKSAKYEQPVISRSGAVIPGNVARANAENLYVKTAYGQTTVAWKDVSAATVVEMANKLVTEPDPSSKQWLIGVYVTLCGNAAEGKQMLIDAAQSNATLRDQLTVFF